MELLQQLFEYFLHVDRHLLEICTAHGAYVYVLLFFVVFCETGLVVTPFLPGDSLLFAVGSLAAIGALDLSIATTVLISAALIGNTTNYWIGYFVGPKVFHYESSRFFKKEYLERTHRFYEKHGGKTIIIARFIPIVRTFAPFVAGVGRMTYTRFISRDVFGGSGWVLSFVLTGFYFGNLPIIKNNFGFVIIAIILISLLPGIIEFIRARYFSKESA